MKKVIIALSGGLDSAVALSSLLADGYTVQAIGFFYGSKHNSFENSAAARIAEYYNIPFKLIDVATALRDFQSALLLTGGEIPEGHYEHTSMKQTVVPGRNLIFASIIAGLAESMQFNSIALGVHQGDHFIYPDCRPAFIDALAETISESTEGKVTVLTPLLHLTKAQVVAQGWRLGTPFHLTRTCYKEQAAPCGKCGSCVERKEAFEVNGLSDPAVYAM